MPFLCLVVFIIDKYIKFVNTKNIKKYFFPLCRRGLFDILRRIERMRYIARLFTVFLICGPVTGHAATCSKLNLTKCLDSVCAINSGANSAARCQYCGTASVGMPPKKTTPAVTVGQSSSTTITEKELKNAPTDAGARYAWATEQCLKKNAGCTLDDVTDNYDKLIEQSCKAACVSMKMDSSIGDVTKEKTQKECATDIESCLYGENYCGAGFERCTSDADFDRYFSACAANAAGCVNYTADLRATMIAGRDDVIKNAAATLNARVTEIQNTRQALLQTARNICTNDKGREDCIESVCATNMPNQCQGDFEKSERAAAVQWCKFYDVACGKLKL